MEKERSCVQDFGEESKGERTMRKWKDNIKMDFQVTEWRILHWIDLVQGKER
jgi:hypothetical protein